MDNVLQFAKEWPNHPQPTKTAGVCLVQTKMNFNFILPTSIDRYWCEENIIYVIDWIGCASNFAKGRPNHPQPTKTAGVCLVQTKMNFNFALPTSIYKYWCEENIIYDWVGCASILYKWPCSQCSVQKK